MPTDRAGVIISRALAFFAIWLAITGWEPKDAIVGIVAAAASTWVSISLFPRLGPRVRPASVAALILHVLRGSIVAGFDVARRALSPTPDVRPGFVSFPLRIPPGKARNAFSALSSLQPGALPTGADDGALIVHCIDVTQPVRTALARDERRFMQAFGYE